ncbi:MAG: hypothetical protein ACR2IE_03395 [Candidatus Sumerlaeaceae bacterium]
MRFQCLQQVISSSCRILVLAALCALCVPLRGQSVTTSSKATGASSAQRQQGSTLTVALVGERPLVAANRKKHVDLLAITTHTLGLDVHDFTTNAQVLEEIARESAPVISLKPTIVIVFAGAADEKLGTDDDRQQDWLKSIVNSFTSVATRVYIVPSSPSIGTLTAANLRLAASSTGATFIETGSQISGKPYEEAFQAIRGAEQNPAPTATPATLTERLPQPRLALPPLDETTQSQSSEPKGIFVAPTPASPDELVHKPATGAEQKAADAETTGRRTVTKRGAEAEPAIIPMKPLPALKSFSPKRPVPRKNTDKKAPEMAR